MPDFAVTPPVHVGTPATIVRSIAQAADFVRKCEMGNLDGETSGLLEKLHNVQSPEQAQHAGLAFKAWLGKRDVLLVPPDAARAVRAVHGFRCASQFHWRLPCRL